MAVTGALLAGLAAGVLSGWGVGGGSLLLIYLTAAGGLSQLEAQGINLLYFLPTALPAVWRYRQRGLLPGRIWGRAVLGGCAGAVCGSLLAPWLPELWLRRGFGALMLVLGLRELLRKG